MKRGLKLLCSIGIGAGIIYFLRSGKMKRCRSMVREKSEGYLRESKKALKKVLDEVEDQTEKLWHVSHSLLRSIRHSL